MHASNRRVSEDEEENDVFSQRPLYCGRAGSDCGEGSVGRRNTREGERVRRRAVKRLASE